MTKNLYIEPPQYFGAASNTVPRTITVSDEDATRIVNEYKTGVRYTTLNYGPASVSVTINLNLVTSIVVV